MECDIIEEVNSEEVSLELSLNALYRECNQ